MLSIQMSEPLWPQFVHVSNEDNKQFPGRGIGMSTEWVQLNHHAKLHEAVLITWPCSRQPSCLLGHSCPSSLIAWTLARFPALSASALHTALSWQIPSRTSCGLMKPPLTV